MHARPIAATFARMSAPAGRVRALARAPSEVRSRPSAHALLNASGMKPHVQDARIFLAVLAVFAILAFGCSSGDLPVDEATTDADAPEGATASPGRDPSDREFDRDEVQDRRDGGVLDGGSEPGDDAATTDGGSDADGTDAMTDAGPLAAGNAFTGAGPYVQTTGPSTLSNRHTPANPAGQACLTCHGGQRNGVRAFLFAGTIYNAEGQAVPNVEVRVRDRLGSAVSAFSDANGNFFAPRANALAAPARAGVRNAATTKVMTNVINNGDCNSCHGPAMRLTL